MMYTNARSQQQTRRHRSWAQFSVRTALIAIAFICAAIAILFNRVRRCDGIENEEMAAYSTLCNEWDVSSVEYSTCNCPRSWLGRGHRFISRLECDGRSFAVNSAPHKFTELCEMLGEFRFLEDFTITGAIATRESLGCIGEMNNLRRLNLAHGDITDEGIRSLARLQLIRDASFDGTEVTDNCFLVFSQWQLLESLQCLDTAISGRNLGQLANCPRLEFLTCGGVNGSDDILINASNLPRLSELKAKGKFTERGAVGIGKSSSLRHLSIIGAFDDSCCRAMRISRHLESVSLEASPLLTNAGIAELCEISTLRLIRIDSCRGVDEDGLYVSRNRELRIIVDGYVVAR